MTYRLVCAGQRVLLQRLQLRTLKEEGNKHEKRLMALLNIWLRMTRVARYMDQTTGPIKWKRTYNFIFCQVLTDSVWKYTLYGECIWDHIGHLALQTQKHKTRTKMWVWGFKLLLWCCVFSFVLMAYDIWCFHVSDLMFFKGCCERQTAYSEIKVMSIHSKGHCISSD